MQGIASASVNWGAWAGSGMAAKAGVARMERMGFGAIEPSAGAAVLLGPPLPQRLSLSSPKLDHINDLDPHLEPLATRAKLVSHNLNASQDSKAAESLRSADA